MKPAMKSAESWINSTDKSNSESRLFKVKNIWTRSTLSAPNEKYRKINRMTPIIAGSLLIQGNGLDGIVAYDRLTGTQKWRVNVTNGVEGGAAVINDRLFFGGNDGNFYSVSLRDGKVLWTYAAKAENLSEPVIDSINGVVFFLSGNNVVFALEAESGRQVWTYSRQDTNNFSIRGGTKPALKNDILYVGFSEGSLIAFNAKSGSPIWEVQLNKNKRFRDIDATPILDGDFLYISGYDDKLYCIQSSRGEIVWKIDNGGYYGVSIDGNNIYYPTSGGEVLALRKSNGSKIWSYQLPDGISTGVKSYKGLIVFGESQGKLMFLDKGTGKKIGEYEPGRGILSTPAVDEKNERLYFISGEANVYSLEARWENPSPFPYLR